jgi:hypothetical protein
VGRRISRASAEPAARRDVRLVAGRARRVEERQAAGEARRSASGLDALALLASEAQARPRLVDRPRRGRPRHRRPSWASRSTGCRLERGPPSRPRSHVRGRPRSARKSRTSCASTRPVPGRGHGHAGHCPVQSRHVQGQALDMATSSARYHRGDGRRRLTRRAPGADRGPARLGP